MRRDTFIPNNGLQRKQNLKRYQTFVAPDDITKAQKKQKNIKNFFSSSQYVVDYFIDEILISKCLEELQSKGVQKYVNQAMMSHCNSFFHHQTWQIEPQGPYNQKKSQTELIPDKEPQSKIFDPTLSLQKPKGHQSSRSSIALSSFKKTSYTGRKSIFVNQLDRSPSTRSNTSRTPKHHVSYQNFKLIPLRFENGITPQLSTRRTLQDFLRERKINAQINLGYKIRNFSQEKQNLKTIVEFPKSNFFTTTTISRNIQTVSQNQKLTQKQELSMDYDGKAIQIKKASNLRKPAQILKMLCKVKKQDHEVNKFDVHTKYFRPEQIKLKPIHQRNDSFNMNAFTLRFSAQEDIKGLVEKDLYTNRIKFRQQQVSDQMIQHLNVSKGHNER